eukprot:scaffold7897_cov403-Prasinococcus_capsulatus_cf.AAC.1
MRTLAHARTRGLLRSLAQLSLAAHTVRLHPIGTDPHQTTNLLARLSSGIDDFQVQVGQQLYHRRVIRIDAPFTWRGNDPRFDCKPSIGVLILNCGCSLLWGSSRLRPVPYEQQPGQWKYGSAHRITCAPPQPLQP